LFLYSFQKERKKMTDNQLNIAGRGSRIINFIIDMVAFFVLWILLVVLVLFIGFEKPYIIENEERISLVPMLIIIPTYWGYYLFSEYFFQRTIGKVLTGTKVVSTTGERPNFKQIFWRTIGRSIPFEYISYLVTAQGIHDRFSNTRVVMH
jgi:uncharacterized RDD family membrane protein YckC